METNFQKDEINFDFNFMSTIRSNKMEKNSKIKDLI